MDGNVPSSTHVDHPVGEVITLEGGPDLSDLFGETEPFDPNRSGTFRLEMVNGEPDLVEERV